MRFSASLRTAMLAGASAAAVIASPAAAQAISFNIPAQGLSGALQQFALRTNRDLLYSPELVANLRTAGLAGSFTPEEGLRRLLVGTNLTYRQTAPNVFVLQRNGPIAAISAAMQAPTVGGATSQAAARPAEASSALNGKITDGETGTPIAGAVIRIEGTGLSAVSDDRGGYRFPGLSAGDYVVVLDYLGDPPQSRPVNVGSAETVTLDFTRRAATGEIVVYGYSSAIQRALNQQRTALNNATVVSEDLLGGFPAETVSEAMRRIPGVAFGRDDASGEGSRITVRGFSSEAINVQVNGVDLQGTNFGRTIDLSGYLAENISTITIHKTLLPSHQATGSGGFVQIETRSGLDYGSFHASGSIEGERAVESGFGNEWQANATVGGRITSNLGIVGTISYRDTNRRNFDVAMSRSMPVVFPVGFTSLAVIPASQQFPFDPEFNSELLWGGSYTTRDRDETTLAASINLAWDIGEHTRLRLDLQRNDRDTFNYTTRAVVGFLPTAVDMPIQELGGEVRRRNVLNSFRPNINLISRDESLTTDTISLRGDTNVGRWQFRYKAGYSGAASRSDNTGLNLLHPTLTNIRDIIDSSTIQTAPDDDVAATPRVIGGGYVLGPNGVPVPSLTQLGLDTLFDPTRYQVASANRQITDSTTDAWIIEGSARYAPDSWLQYVEAGFKYDRIERSAADANFASDVGGLRNINSYVPITGRSTFVSDIDPALLITQSFANVGISFAVPSVSARGNEAIFTALDGLLTDDPSTPFNEARFTLNDLTGADPIGNASANAPAGTTEVRLAGYVEAHLEFGHFDMVGGVRYERTRRTGTAIVVPSVRLASGQFEPRTTLVAAGLIDFLDNTGVDTTITPSFLINYRPNNRIVARLGYNRSTVNPSLQNIRRQPQYIVDLRPVANQAILREGNPNLRPTVTDNFDFDVSYYFRDTPGLIRFGGFYKKTTNNFTNLLLTDQPDGEVRERILAYFEPIAASRPDIVAFNDQTEFVLQRPVNGEGGVIYGFELELIRRFDFLPGFLSGFGMIGNVTYTKGDFPTVLGGRTDDGGLTNITLDRPLQDQAAWVYNAALTYSNGGFDGRLIYTRQSVTVETYEIHDLNTVIPAYGTLDLRLSYSFRGPGSGLITVFLEGDDLLRDASDPDIRSAISNTPGRQDAQFFFPTVYQFNGGRTVTLGVRARF